MNISEKKKTEIYNAVSDPITDLRIYLNKYGSPGHEDLDARLFQIQNEIWRKVHKALNMKGPA